MILGAVLAGGAARRFGSDKALAPVDGVPLLDRVARALAPQCDALAVVGRAWPGMLQVHDRPAAGLGPLGALAGALHHAQRRGFDLVLTSGCDLPDVPKDLGVRLAPAPAIVAGQPLLGLWPAALLPKLLHHLEQGERRLQGWVSASGAREVDFGVAIANINTREDLARYEAGEPPIAADRRSSR